MTGYSRAELIGTSPRILQGPKTDAKVIQSLREALSQRQFWEGQTINYRKNGEPYMVNWNISPVLNDRGELTHFVSVQQDITARETATAERDMLLQALNQAHDPVLVSDNKATIVFVNKAFEQVTGYDASEVLGKTPRLLSSGEHNPDFYAGMWRALQEKRPFHARFINKRKDGSRYHTEQSIAPVLDSAGNCTHFISTSWNVDSLVEREQALQVMANIDKLTGLLNRRAGDEKLQQALSAFATGKQPPSLILGDIDHFKRINDRYGHLAGDRILRTVAHAIANQLRAEDSAIRWGGEEFLIVVAAPQHVAELLAERLRQAIASLTDVEVGQVTLSLGVTEAKHHETEAELLSRVDAALYQVKNNGRNQVCSQ